MAKIARALPTEDEYRAALVAVKDAVDAENPNLYWNGLNAIDIIFNKNPSSKGAARTRQVNAAVKALDAIILSAGKPKAINPNVKSLTFICEHCGENAPTARHPRFEYNEAEHKHLLDIRVTRCVAFDNDMGVEINLWATETVELPIWMTPQEYIASGGLTTLRWYLGFGADINWPESWYRKLNALNENVRFAVIKLLNQKSFRAEKRRELRDRFEAWLNDEGDLERYDCSNVRNEYIDRECERTSHHLYWSR